MTKDRGKDDRGAESPLSESLYAELKRLAARQMRGERRDHTLQPTALVHEAWLRLRQGEGAGTLEEGAFRALAARTLRRVLIDHARAEGTRKRGGDRRREPLEELEGPARPSGASLLDLEQALAQLSERSARQARVVELHFYGGLSLPEVARAMDLSLDTVKREWRFARAWLNRELARGSER